MQDTKRTGNVVLTLPREACGARFEPERETAERMGRLRNVKRPSRLSDVKPVVRLLLLVCSYPFLLLGCSGDSAAPQAAKLFAIRQKGKWGYIEGTGKVGIEPRFDEALGFSQGLAAVKTGKKWGYLGESGQLVIDAQFDSALPFSEGLALVSVDGGWVYINKQGDVVIRPKCDLLCSFSEGCACVMTGCKAGYIDTTGKTTIELKFDHAFPFSHGFARVVIGEKCKYIDQSGGSRSSPGVMIPRVFPETRLWGRDEESGKRVYFTPLEVVMYAVYEAKWGFIDKTGRMAIKPQFDEAHDFSGGLAAVETGDKWGYIDTTGKMAIEPRFGAADEFAEGLAAVRIGERYGYIDEKGQIVIEPQFNGAGSFSEGVAVVVLGKNVSVEIGREGKEVVSVDGEMACIDKTGRVLFKLDSVGINRFVNGLARVRAGKKVGYIDKSGKYVWEPTE